MGILSALFGGNKSTTEGNDGVWLKGERNSTWEEVAKFDKSQPIELSLESCYQNQMGTFCVLRSFNKGQNVMLFMGCVIPEDQNDFILIVVDRGESLNGDVMMRDDWTKNRILEKSKIPDIGDAIQKIENYAAFNDYSTLPPFVFYLTMNLGR